MMFTVVPGTGTAPFVQLFGLPHDPLPPTQLTVADVACASLSHRSIAPDAPAAAARIINERRRLSAAAQSPPARRIAVSPSREVSLIDCANLLARTGVRHATAGAHKVPVAGP